MNAAKPAPKDAVKATDLPAEITKRFSKQGLEDLFSKIGAAINSPVEVFLLGGGAMAFRNQKASTKDIDIVVGSKKEADEISLALIGLGYEKRGDLEREYEEMNAEGGIWEAAGHVRVDLFVKVVCGCLELTPSVRKRSEKLGEYGKLTVNLLSNEDVILFKGITERVDDVNDIAAIVRSSNIAWDTVLQECTDQSGKRAWFGLLLNKIEELKLQGIDIPIERKLIALDKRRLLHEAYRLRLKKMTAKQAAEKLRELGFTNKELADAGIKG